MTTFAPMLATPARALPEGRGWSYEVKWDGYRTLAIKEGSTVRLISRRLNNISAQYPAVVPSCGQGSRRRGRSGW